MKKLLLIILIHNIPWVVTYSQCSVSKKKETHSTTYIASFEKVYKNTDLENGVLEFDLRITLTVDTSSQIADTYLLECVQITRSYPYEISPRKLVLKFENEKSYVIPALLQEKVPGETSGYSAVIFTFQVSEELLNQLRNFGCLH